MGKVRNLLTSAVIGPARSSLRACLSASLAAMAVCGAVLPAAASASTDLGANTGLGGIVVDDAAQHVFVSLPKANNIDEFDFSGNLVTTIHNVYGAWGMTIDGNDLYVAESTSGTIARIDLTQSTPSAQPIATGLDQPMPLVMTGGKLWTTSGDSQAAHIDSIDPTTGTVTPSSGTDYDPDLAVSAGDPSTLFAAQDGLSRGSVYRFSVSGANATETSNVYPANPYPSAVAVSASGLLATGIDNGYSSPDISVYKLGAPAAVWTATTQASGAPATVLPHGLALSADGSKLFAVTGSVSTDDQFTAYSLGAPAPTVTNPTGTNPTGAKPGSTSKKPTPSSSWNIVPMKPLPTRPDVALELGAFRSPIVSSRTHRLTGYHYYFMALDIRCFDGATKLIFTVGRSSHAAPCSRRPILVSKPLAPQNTYKLRVRAVRARGHKIVKRGASLLGPAVHARQERSLAHRFASPARLLISRTPQG